MFSADCIFGSRDFTQHLTPVLIFIHSADACILVMRASVNPKNVQSETLNRKPVAQISEHLRSYPIFRSFFFARLALSIITCNKHLKHQDIDVIHNEVSAICNKGTHHIALGLVIFSHRKNFRGEKVLQLSVTASFEPKIRVYVCGHLFVQESSERYETDIYQRRNILVYCKLPIIITVVP